MSKIKLDSIAEDADLSLEDILEFFTENWGKILSLSVLGAALGGGYGLWSIPSYEATGNIQVAKVANVDLEAPGLVLAKLTTSTFYSEETVVACTVSNKKNPRDALVGKAIKTTLNKSLPIITIAARHSTPELAKQCLDSILKDIRSNQGEMMDSSLKLQKEQLMVLRQQLLLADNLTESILQDHRFGLGVKYSSNDEKIAVSTFSSLVSTIKKLEIESIRARANDLEINLSPPRTLESNFISPIYAPDTPAGISPFLLAIMGALVAGILSVIFLLIKNSLLRAGH
jgi:hypothetical protein